MRHNRYQLCLRQILCCSFSCRSAAGKWWFMLLMPICSSPGICYSLMISASIPGGQCWSACISYSNTMVIQVGATWGAVTAVMSHLQFCCVLATGRMSMLGKTDLSSNLVQLVSCVSWAVGVNIIYCVLLCYRLSRAGILSFDVGSRGWLEVSKCLTAGPSLPLLCAENFLNHALKRS